MSACFRLVFLLLAMTLSACSTPGNKQPDWVNANSGKHPEQAYLIGRGQSENRALAQDRARADLSKIFQVQISEQSEDVVSYEAQVYEAGKVSSSASRNIQSQTNQIIEGIRIAEIWQNPVDNQYHALAILDRNQAANNLRQAIQQQDAATEDEIALARQQTNLFSQIGHASQAVAIQFARGENQRVLKIVDPTGIGAPPTYNLNSLRSQRNALLERVKIELQLTNDPIGGVEPILQGALAEAGFTHTTGDKANYLLQSDLQLDGFKDSQGWFWYRGSLQINLLDITGKESQGSHRWDLKVSAQNSGTAAQRARDLINEKLNAELRNVIISFGTAK